MASLALAAGLVAPQHIRAQDSRPGVAVLSFDNGGSYGQDKENFDALQVGLQQMLVTELSANAAIRVVDRREINKLISEQDLGATGRVDQSTAAKLGKLVGARYMIMGGFVDFYGDFRIDARVVNVETGEIMKTEKVRDKRENLYGLVTNLANQITKGASLPPLARPAMEQREKRQVPTEAVTYYSRALLYADRGDSKRATELYNKAIEIFPDYTEAKQGLQQLGRS